MRIRGLIIALGFFFFGSAVHARPTLPERAGYVTDQAELLTKEQRDQLEGKLTRFAARSRRDLAVLIVAHMPPGTIERFSFDVAKAWGLSERGVLLNIALKDRQMRIEVGRELDHVLDYATSKRILGEALKSHFKREEYFEGIEAGLTRIEQELLPESFEEPTDVPEPVAAPVAPPRAVFVPVPPHPAVEMFKLLWIVIPTCFLMSLLGQISWASRHRLWVALAGAFACFGVLHSYFAVSLTFKLLGTALALLVGYVCLGNKLSGRYYYDDYRYGRRRGYFGSSGGSDSSSSSGGDSSSRGGASDNW